MTPKNHVYIIIPAKDEERHIHELVEKIVSLGYKHIILVNDSSEDDTANEAKQTEEVTILDHIINLGPGAATQTGITHAVEKKAGIIVTIDADLQHDPNDIDRLVQYLDQHDLDLVIGSRFLKKNDIPKSRVIYNKIANIISYALTGVYLSDSQSGLKAIRGTLGSRLDLNYDGYGFEFCMEIIKQAREEGANIGEYPVNVRYTPETTRKGQNLFMGIRMVTRLLSPFN